MIEGFEPKGVINIGMEKVDGSPESFLSNFAQTKFELDGIVYPSIESFYQSLRIPPDNQLKYLVASEQNPKIALKKVRKYIKKIKREAQQPDPTKSIYYQNEVYKYGSPEHHQIVKMALVAKFTQNEQAKKALLSTKDQVITHILIKHDGNRVKDSIGLPGGLFCNTLMEIRDRLKNIKLIKLNICPHPKC